MAKNAKIVPLSVRPELLYRLPHEILPLSSCQVTEANKREYVKLYVNYRWCHGIEQQFLALHKGFHEVVPPHHLKPFDERELELVIGR